ncbi:hypothetical protein [[Clostridium] polysaccharolyticum]|uniref:Uncharacterized protein n=1 Tax=[Clostridium] polysaccharolyticum TaxID=29364 RepID=A0A1H9Y4R8_9FIRM|nr:hypothetical protein [[Clostridium] polysaccharolyticum]SES63824.1 hypothetical protein SAMN04487772_101142 [[Clostridium] polysaccharolyticum]
MENAILAILTWFVQMSEPVILNWFWSKIATPIEERKKMQAIGMVFLCGYICILSAVVGKVGNMPFLVYSLNNLSVFVNVWYAVIFMGRGGVHGRKTLNLYVGLKWIT